MEVFPGCWKGRRVALIYLRKSGRPDREEKVINLTHYRHLLQAYLQRQRDILFEIKIMAREFFIKHCNVVRLFAVSYEDDDIMPDECDIFAPIMIVELADERHSDLTTYSPALIIKYQYRLNWLQILSRTLRTA